MKEVEVRFRENFPAGRDSGSGMCFFEGEKKLISLYGGYLDAECLRPWREDTLVGIGSGTKGVVVACALHAMQEAGADLDSIIADFWPEFAQGGKRAMTHAFGGVPYGLSCDWDLIGIYYSDNSTHPCTFNFVMVEAELS